ncbi:CMRF35-like molecule 5 isoform X2 [Denticeps clupeoides]|uniref:CMRF35-like molecule 5 isoform X2 n=1 Tax=Denticeps clupeoides TaxID=299321 RepID=UPI0010A377C3|nr:CMRF35-like molecule 5 isoform X2 [Denticeps clupeoides]
MPHGGHLGSLYTLQKPRHRSNCMDMFFLKALLLVFLHGFPGSFSLWTVSKVAMQTGGSVTIPCHYHHMYKDAVKYWCKGKAWATCLEIGRHPLKGQRTRFLVTDDPTELVITLTMRNLQVRDTNRYWCAVKLGGFMRPDVRSSFTLQVTDDLPALYVKDTMMLAEVGTNVTVTCHYSNSLKSSVKKWCESGDLHSCKMTQNSEASLEIADDGEGVFTVTMMEVQRKGTGWYWCSAGDIQAPVHINVTQGAQSNTAYTQQRTTSILALQSTTLPAASLQTPGSPSASASLQPSTSTALRVPTHQATSSGSSSLTARPSDNYTISISSHRPINWHLVVPSVGTVFSVVVVVGVSWRCWTNHKRDLVRTALDNMTDEMSLEEDMEEEFQNTCLLHHDIENQNDLSV